MKKLLLLVLILSATPLVCAFVTVVSNLQGRTISSATPVLNDVLTWDGAVWKPLAPPGPGGLTGLTSGQVLVATGTNTVASSPKLTHSSSTGATTIDGDATVTGSLTVNGVPVTGSASAGGPSYTNLRVWTPDDATFRIQADAISLTNGTDWKSYPSVNVTVDVAGAVGPGGIDAAGVNTALQWIAIHLVGKSDGTIAGIASASGPAPTLPATFAYSRLVSGTFNEAGPVLRHMRQSGDAVSQATPARLLNGAGVSHGWITVDASAQVPPWSVRAQLNVYATQEPVAAAFRPDALFGEEVDNQLYTVASDSPRQVNTFYQQLSDTQTFDYEEVNIGFSESGVLMCITVPGYIIDSL